MSIVAKFGGTSLADAARIQHVVRVIRSDPTRTCVVVSAPGKRYADDTKITDLLEGWVNASENQRESIFEEIRIRFIEIVKVLGLSLDIDELFDNILKKAKRLKWNKKLLFHFMRSRGEWLNAQIVAAACDFEFVDAADFISFTWRGQFDMHRTIRRADKLHLSEKAKNGIVVPGFYGRTPWRTVCSFSRGGSDITGTIVAVLVNADEYENWTDVEGVLQADPRIVSDAKKIDEMTYAELRELTFMGASVFHQDAAAFVWKAGIPTHIRCTMTPGKAGTLVVSSLDGTPGTITGIAGKNGFTVLTLEKYGVDEEIGFLYRLAGVFKELGISIDHAPGTVDTMSVVIDSEQFRQKRKEILKRIQRRCEPDKIRVLEDVTLICTVGLGMKNIPGMAGRLMSAVGRAGVSIELINQGASEINIVIGVQKEDGDRAIRAINDEFFPG
ncbi:hypothetical protein A3A39_03825 [Candidatus Kaiserbacteria bacterium RIFCSPLOWO2_01_FULL_54_13]|uniref:Aspartokinase n=1 Tax=Candidatus Kaiserbacteria bacterium RIFCSPLOWO2_01_FULL_54_13 TaxID=1798512 RepID=A0A1F6F225_9BACT|nr:MAG: hypothetical protein A3A39_03825 [Candidatus Kaiserbacteria bacterium RIFCSPLOWO2_01_FULL_54_13]